MLVLRRQPAHGAEAGQDEWVHRRLAAAREHGVGASAADELGALTDRMRARRAGRDDRVVGPADAERDRELAARRVDEDVREEVGRHAVGAALAEHLALLHDPDEAADRGAEDDAYAGGLVSAVERGVV